MKSKNSEALEKLIQQKHKNSISIYISSFKETKDATNAQKLDSQLKEAEKELLNRGMKQKEIDTYVAPVKELLSDSLLLYQTWDGMAIFLNDNFFEYYVVPGITQNYTYIGNEFYILPFLETSTKNSTYYVLALQLHGVHLYKGDRFNISKIEIENFVPQKLETALGWQDYKNEMYVHKGAHIQGGIKQQAQFRGAEENKKEIEEFLRYVDRELLKAIKNKGIPLIIASVDYIFSFYKDISSYSPILDKHICESPQNQSPYELKEKAWDIIKNYYARDKQKAVKQYHETTNKSDIPEEILYNTKAGKTDTLYVNSKAFLWGSYNETNDQVQRHENKHPSDIELINLTAINAITHNSNVFLLNSDEMPQSGIEMAAVYRY